MQLNRGLLGGSENLIDVDDVTLSTSGYVMRHYIFTTPLSAGTYTLSFYFSGTDSSYQVVITDSNNNTIIDPVSQANTGRINTLTFTLDTSASYIDFYSNAVGTYSNLMLNVGSTALPYKAYSGNIVFEADIEPTLLWENSSPTSTFANQTITTADMSSFKYIVIEAKITLSATDIGQMFKVKYATKRGFISYTASTTTYNRQFNIASATTIEFADSVVNGSTDNAGCIPTAIYGTNIL